MREGGREGGEGREKGGRERERRREGKEGGRGKEEGRDLITYLVKESYVEREPKWVLQSYLLCQLTAQLLGSGGRVSQQGLGVAIHESDRQHQRLLGLSSLQRRRMVCQSRYCKHNTGQIDVT